MTFNLYDTIWVTGLLLPRDIIVNVSLSQLETMLGYPKGSFNNGAIIATLTEIPTIGDLDYCGDKRFREQNSGKYGKERLSKEAMDHAAYAHLTDSGTSLLKILPGAQETERAAAASSNPVGLGGMQWRLHSGVKKRATVTEIITGYPYGSVH